MQLNHLTAFNLHWSVLSMGHKLLGMIGHLNLKLKLGKMFSGIKRSGPSGD